VEEISGGRVDMGLQRVGRRQRTMWSLGGVPLDFCVTVILLLKIFISYIFTHKYFFNLPL
jgi:hypothetical protein